MHQKMKITSALLIVLLFIEIPTFSLGFGMMKGGGGGSSSVAEILAAGLITGLFLDSKSKSRIMYRAVTTPFLGGYSAMHPRHVMYPMITPRYPMMESFIYPAFHRPHYNIMNPFVMAQEATNQAMMAQAANEQAMMAQAAKEQAMMVQAAKKQAMTAQAAKEQAMMAQAAKDQAMSAEAEKDQSIMTQAEKDQALLIQAVEERQALASRLNEEIKALEAQESMLEAALERTRQGDDTAISELLKEETALPAAALLLETSNILDSSPVLETPAVLPSPVLPPPEMYQAAPSEPESRYILPRIVRHFVQRLLKRGESHK